MPVQIPSAPNPHSIRTWLNACQSALATEAKVPVRYFPENPESYKPDHASGALLVSSLGRDFSGPKASTGHGSEYRIKIQITVVSRALMAENHGAYELLDFVYDRLTGRKINGRALWPQREFFIGRDNDLWKFGAIYYATFTRYP